MRKRAGLAIGQDAQHGKEVGAALNLIDDDNPPERLECKEGFGQTGLVGGILQIEEMGRLLQPLAVGVGQGGLAHLASPDNTYHAVFAK